MSDRARIGVDGEVVDHHVFDAAVLHAVGRDVRAVRLAADRHAVTRSEMVVGNDEIGDPMTALDGDLVVAGGDGVARDHAAGRDVGRPGIDAIGVAGKVRRHEEALAIDSAAAA